MEEPVRPRVGTRRRPPVLVVRRCGGPWSRSCASWPGGRRGRAPTAPGTSPRTSSRCNKTSAGESSRTTHNPEQGVAEKQRVSGEQPECCCQLLRLPICPLVALSDVGCEIHVHVLFLAQVLDDRQESVSGSAMQSGPAILRTPPRNNTTATASERSECESPCTSERACFRVRECGGAVPWIPCWVTLWLPR